MDALPLISGQLPADWQLQYLRWRYLKNWTGNIFQSAKFILELRSSASPHYEQDIGEITHEDQRPLIGQSDPILASDWQWHYYQGIWSSWPLDRLRDIDTRLEYFWPKHQIEISPFQWQLILGEVRGRLRLPALALITGPTLITKIKHETTLLLLLLPACLQERQEVGSKFRVETVKCPNCCRLLLPSPYSLRAEIFSDKKVDDTVSLLCGHNLKMIIIINAIIGFEISFWTGFFQIPRIWYGRWLAHSAVTSREAWSGPPWARPRTTHRWQEQNIERRPNTCNSM